MAWESNHVAFLKPIDGFKFVPCHFGDGTG
jgi:hypothetical protein